MNGLNVKCQQLLRAGVLGILSAAFLGGCSEKSESTVTSDPDPKEPVPAPTTDEQPPAPALPSSSGDAEPISLETFSIPEGAKLVMTVHETRTIMLRGPDNLENNVRHFETTLAKLGWSKNEATSEILEGVGFLGFTKGALAITITLNPDSGRDTMAIMAQGSGISVPEDTEDF